MFWNVVKTCKKMLSSVDHENACFVHAINVSGDQYGFDFMNKNSWTFILNTLFCVPQKNENHARLKKDHVIYGIICSKHRQAE